MIRSRRRAATAGVLGLLAAAGAGLGIVQAGHGGPAGAPGPADPAAAVLALFAARDEASCEAYAATTTQFFRDDAYLGSSTCEAFAAEAAEHAALAPVRVRIESVVRVDVDTAQVEAVETYRAGTSREYRLGMAYRVRHEGDAWRVDHVDLTVLR